MDKNVYNYYMSDAVIVMDAMKLHIKDTCPVLISFNSEVIHRYTVFCNKS